MTIKPKYPVNAFNMFAKSGRESVKREFSQFPVNVSVSFFPPHEHYLFLADHEQSTKSNYGAALERNVT